MFQAALGGRFQKRLFHVSKPVKHFFLVLGAVYFMFESLLSVYFMFKSFNLGLEACQACIVGLGREYLK